MPDIAQRLNQLLTHCDSPKLPPGLADKFVTYYDLLQKWNAKTNLTSIRDQEGILSRHFLESILCARTLPRNIVSLLDYGSGAGFPGIPIALIRKELEVTLAESQNKKTAFLKEAIRTLSLPTKVHAARAEDLKERFDCITLRAVDNMDRAIQSAIHLLNLNGSLIVMTTAESAAPIAALAPSHIHWDPPTPLPPGTNRQFLKGTKVA